VRRWRSSPTSTGCCASAVPPTSTVLRDFVLQSVWAMFAEDLSMLPSHLLTRVLDGLLADPARSSRDDLGQLFAYLNEPKDRPTEGIYAGTPYANGSLFARPARVHLEREELELLRQACDANWRKVEPAIFGTLLQGALGRERQWALGAHYTAEADILKIVLPTIVEPWWPRADAIIGNPPYSPILGLRRTGRTPMAACGPTRPSSQWRSSRRRRGQRRRAPGGGHGNHHRGLTGRSYASAAAMDANARWWSRVTIGSRALGRLESLTMTTSAAGSIQRNCP